jgi:hypothetical protein
MDIFAKRAEKKSDGTNDASRKKQTARKSPVSKLPRKSHASKLAPKIKPDLTKGNIIITAAFALDIKAIFYCKKCGHEIKGISFTQEHINEFRKHPDENDEGRCLDTGLYKENHAEVLGVYFYVMEQSQNL